MENPTPSPNIGHFAPEMTGSHEDFAKCTYGFCLLGAADFERPSDFEVKGFFLNIELSCDKLCDPSCKTRHDVLCIY